MLREARWHEREKINQIYFPVKGKDIILPKMFEDEHLQVNLQIVDFSS